jgi:hypothetical protein
MAVLGFMSEQQVGFSSAIIIFGGVTRLPSHRGSPVFWRFAEAYRGTIL